MTLLKAQAITGQYGRRVVFQDLSVAIEERRITVLVGPNGSGKSTLLKHLCRLLHPEEGQVQLDGVPLDDWQAKALARRVGVLPQHQGLAEGLTVEELVAFGRYPHQTWTQRLGGPSAADRAAVARALAATGLTANAQSLVQHLSGGQRQRAWIAMTLAQETTLIVLDEPTSYLDLKHQVATMTLLKDLCVKEGKTILMVLHDLNLAARIADQVIVMAKGCVVTQGAPGEVLTPALLKEVYEVDAAAVPHPTLGVPQFLL